MNLIIVHSAINTCDAPLSYYPIRSLYPKEVRFTQTLASIKSIEKIPDKKILFIEATNIPEFEEEIKSRVDFYVNIYSGNEAIIDGPYKGLGYALSFIRGMGAVEPRNYDNLYMLAGRYFLTDDFDFGRWNNNNTIFNVSDVLNGLLLVFYKINIKDYDQWMAALCEFYETKNSISIETFFANRLTGFTQIDKVGVEGLTHGGTHVIF